MSASRFATVQTLDKIKKIYIIEDHTFQTVMLGRYLDPSICPNATNKIIMSRDYFDFFVEHLSSTLNIAESNDINVLLLNRSTIKAQDLRAVAEISRNKHHGFNLFYKSTIAIIPFATTSGLEHNENGELTRALREKFFEQTFWSIHRNFEAVAVSVTNDQDYDALIRLNLPLFQVINKRNKNIIEKVDNVRLTLLNAYEQLKTNSTWSSRFLYVYFTEGDQILHARSLRHLYDVLSHNDFSKELVLVPHRMQVNIKNTIIKVTLRLFCNLYY